MIKYRPNRPSLSSSVKDEQIFDNIDQMKLLLLDRFCRIALYVGHRPFLPEDIRIGEPEGDDPLVGWKNVRPVILKQSCIGYCGE